MAARPDSFARMFHVLAIRRAYSTLVPPQRKGADKFFNFEPHYGANKLTVVI